MDYYSKYLKYKQKYLSLHSQLKNQYGAYDIRLANKQSIDREIIDFKRQYPQYTDSFLTDYQSIINSVKLLLNIPVQDDIIINSENVLHNEHIRIFPENLIDGQPYMHEFGCTSKRQQYNLFGVSISRSVLNLPKMIQLFIISHEIGHIILSKFLEISQPKLLIPDGGIKLEALSKATELICDLIGIALVFITCRRDENIIIETRMTPNEKNLMDSLTPTIMRPVWGSGSATHPHTNVRLAYSRRIFGELTRKQGLDLKYIRNRIIRNLEKFLGEYYRVHPDTVHRSIRENTFPESLKVRPVVAATPVVAAAPAVARAPSTTTQLVNMGFPRSAVVGALQQSGDNFDVALNTLLSLPTS
jgi:hypothetical protein